MCGTASRSPTRSAKSAAIPRRSSPPASRKGAYHCYLELHIEQGGTLDEGGLPIGVVDGIVRSTGMTSKSAASPTMPERPRCPRADALVAAAHLTIAVDEIVRREGPAGGTVGQLNVTPNAPNVVPGAVKLTVELRDLDAARSRGSPRSVRERTESPRRQVPKSRCAPRHHDAAATPEPCRRRSSGRGEARLAPCATCRAEPATTRR